MIIFLSRFATDWYDVLIEYSLSHVLPSGVLAVCSRVQKRLLKQLACNICRGFLCLVC